MKTTSAALGFRCAGVSDIGCVRSRNEDAFLADEERGLFMVADGVGGIAGGDVASAMVVQALSLIITKGLRSCGRADKAIRKLLSDSVLELSRQIFELGRDSAEYRNLGATALVALVRGRRVHLASMGDSRAYLVREGEMSQLTHDHSLVGLLLERGEISAQEAADHPARGKLTRFVGMEAEVDPDVQTLQIRPGDRLLLCTDGLWGMVPDAQLKAILTEGNNPDITCRSLLVAGKQAGGQDNLTVVVCDLLDGARA